METLTLTIYDETAKREILSFLKKFEPLEEHPFFGMAIDERESVEEAMDRLRGGRA